MDGRASQSIAGTHLNAWPPPVALLKFASLFLLSTPSCRTPYAVLFLPLSFHRPSTSESRIRVCLSQRQVAFYCPASYSPRVHPFGSFPPLFESCLGCSLVRLFIFFPLLFGLFFIDIPFAHRAVPWLLFALLLASFIATLHYFTVFLTPPFH
ncbi:hypothetical protein LI328DRAFT_14375 [Trichoderma asperelloides]|nr:hypothetical protein LI328DRAFT_14375 [Trichoderma asperelloides]